LAVIQLVLQTPFSLDVTLSPLPSKGLPPARRVREVLVHKRAVAAAAGLRGTLADKLAARAEAFDAKVARLFPKLLEESPGACHMLCSLSFVDVCAVSCLQ
jgi:hypothetical protein